MHTFDPHNTPLYSVMSRLVEWGSDREQALSWIGEGTVHETVPRCRTMCESRTSLRTDSHLTRRCVPNTASSKSTTGLGNKQIRLFKGRNA